MKVLAAIAVLALSIGDPIASDPPPVNRYSAMTGAIEVFATSYCQARTLGASSDEAIKSAVADKINKFLSNYADQEIGLQEWSKIAPVAEAKQSLFAIQKLCPELIP